MKNNLLLLTILCLLTRPLNSHTKNLDTTKNAYEQLHNHGLTKGQSIRLHFGCGQTYFKNYINIDFPSTHHTMQGNTSADIFADITQLKFPPNSIDEIRSHHLFEHFDRPTALALLSKWHEWLKIGGKIVIETPDLEACITLLNSNKYNYSQKQTTLRHVFGSHEAAWAYHYDGWYEDKFKHTLSQFNFEKINVTKIVNRGWELVPNVLISATKKGNISSEKYKAIARNILSDSLVNNTETKMLAIWLDAYDNAISLMHLEEH